MNNPSENLPLAPGFLRLSLLGMSALNLIPALISLLLAPQTSGAEHGFWMMTSNYVAPTLAPLLIVVLLFDYIMSRVRAADAEGAERLRYARIARIELGVIGISLLIWIPYFVSRLN